MKHFGIILVAGLAVSACTNSPLSKSGRQLAAEMANGAGGGAGANGLGLTGGAPIPGVSELGASPFSATGAGNSVLFPVDQALLTAEAVATLDTQAVWLANNPSISATIEGHADEQGTRAYNIALGERRAAAVYNYLISRGVSPARLRMVSFGKERPVSLCSNESCWSQNRRAVTVVAGGGLGS